MSIMLYNYLFYPALGIILLLLLSSCTVDRSIPVVDNFKPQNYMGKWYEIARLPNHFQSGLTNVYAIYSLNEDNTIKVENFGTNGTKIKSITGKAKLNSQSNIGELKVSFFYPFYSSYRIIKLAPDYRYSIVIGNKPKNLWILSRTKELTLQDLREINHFLKANKIPINKLLWNKSY
jgi:apolipoprotein D and lipocalin family protein